MRQNDETLERIYIGRQFRNDTERLEKLFEMYTEMTPQGASAAKPAGEEDTEDHGFEHGFDSDYFNSDAMHRQIDARQRDGHASMQERAYQKRGEQYLLIKSPPASGKSRALMYIALDKLANQSVKQVLIVVPERSIGASFNDEPLSATGFWADWTVKAQWNLCNMPGAEDVRAGNKRARLRLWENSWPAVMLRWYALMRLSALRWIGLAWRHSMDGSSRSTSFIMSRSATPTSLELNSRTCCRGGRPTSWL